MKAEVPKVGFALFNKYDSILFEVDQKKNNELKIMNLTRSLIKLFVQDSFQPSVLQTHLS